MEIISHGKFAKTIRCGVCGCIFTAVLKPTLTVVDNKPIILVGRYGVSCPECGQYLIEDERSDYEKRDKRKRD